MEKAHSAGAEIIYLPSSLSIIFAKLHDLEWKL